MSRILKIVGIAVGAVVLLLVAAVVAIGFLVDPNDYKDDITRAVANATGRDVAIEGDLELELFPTVRIAVGAAQISNAPGFGDEPFARIGNAGLSVALLPLLSKQIDIEQVRLEGLELNLARDAQGRNNWQDLGGRGGAEAPSSGDAPSGGAGANLDLGVGSIEVVDARVTWTDAAAGSRWVLDDFSLRASDLGPQARFPLAMEFGLTGADVKVAVEADMQATISLADNSYRLDELGVEIAGSGASWPGGEGTALVSFETLAANLDAETVELTGLELKLAGVTMRGSLSGQRLFSDLSLSGAVEIPAFNPRDLLDTFKVAIETADPSVLRMASAKANLLYSSTQLGMRDMTLALDDSELTGRIGLENGTLRYNLAVNDINIDRYLPPAAEGEEPRAEGEGSLDEVDLPLNVLRELAAQGDFRLNRAQFSGLTLANAAFGLTANNGRVELTHRAELYGGTLTGNIEAVIQEDSARVRLMPQLDDIDLRALGRDLLGSEDITGTGDVQLGVVATGSNLGEMRRGLDGDVAFTVTDGALYGIDLWYELLRARARIDSNPVPERPDGPRRTEFTSLSASGVIEDALLTNRDLNATLPFMRVDGMGTVNLLNDEIAFELDATFVDSPMLQSDPGMARLAGQTLPLNVSGTITEPSVVPDFAAVVREEVSEAVNEAVEQERSEVSERVEEQRSEVSERVEEQRDALRDRLRDRLRNEAEDN
jgi:AsmA protein